jgi:hypothetical protein
MCNRIPDPDPQRCLQFLRFDWNMNEIKISYPLQDDWKWWQKEAIPAYTCVLGKAAPTYINWTAHKGFFKGIGSRDWGLGRLLMV